MNYRHIYHAGNFADVMKHVVLSLVIEHLKQKPAPFRVVDTHAGSALYDLSSVAAEKTGEWRDGVARLLRADLSPDAARLLAPYLAIVASLQPPGNEGRITCYPGSPEIARRLLRQDDVLVANELHPEDAARLREHLGRDQRVRIMALDGFMVLKAVLPPKERRGVVLIDPPFEAPGEFGRLVSALVEARRRFETGSVIVWYPIKDVAAVAAFYATVKAADPAKALVAELAVRAPDAARAGLVASGLLIVNPPHTLAGNLGVVLPVLCAAMAQGPGAGWRLDWLIAEKAPGQARRG